MRFLILEFFKNRILGQKLQNNSYSNLFDTLYGHDFSFKNPFGFSGEKR